MSSMLSPDKYESVANVCRKLCAVMLRRSIPAARNAFLQMRDTVRVVILPAVPFLLMETNRGEPKESGATSIRVPR